MEIIVWGLAIFGGYMLWKNVLRGWLLGRHMPSVTERGLLAVIAANYLILLEDGATVDEANSASRAILVMGANMPTEIIFMAKEYIQHQYAGKQLPMIADARAKGFSG